MPKISILMPACNVEKYLAECMDSVLAQTLKDIEIICIDDGSKDSTGKILDEYAAKDSRMQVVHKKNTGYGHSMNVALDLAKGEYIGIVETDDFADPEMFEVMYAAATEHDADVVKTNYHEFFTKNPEKNRLIKNLHRVEAYNTPFAPIDNKKIFMVSPSIWSGIYRTEMIRKNNIRFTETPGASYQDTAFAFKIWACAKTVYLLEDGFLHYRRDNDSSSVNSPRKVFCVCDEYEEIDRFIRDCNKTDFIDIKNAIQFNTYRWNYYRLGVEYRFAFVLKIQETFKSLYDKNCLKNEYFTDDRWADLESIINDPQTYFLQTCKKALGGKETVAELIQENKKLIQENKKLKSQLKKIKDSKSYRLGKALTAVPRKIKKLGK